MLYKTSFHPTTVWLHQVWGRNEIQCLIYVLRCTKYHWGTRAETQRGRHPSSPHWDKPNLYLLGVLPPVRGENTIEDPSHKWVIKLTQQTPDPGSKVLAGQGTQLCQSSQVPLNLEHTIAIESVCTKLSQQDVEGLRANINRVLRGSHPPRSDISKAEAQVIRELKGDKDRLVLTSDKGVAMVVMDRQDYI